jgi:dipeptidyl aminopeptidase/acylaminoacyl peptidase
VSFAQLFAGWVASGVCSDLSGVPFEYLLFPDEGHGVAKAGNRQVATLATVRWFVEHLCNG